MTEPSSKKRGGKTSYELMMSVFGKDKGKLSTVPITTSPTTCNDEPTASLSAKSISKNRSSKLKKTDEPTTASSSKSISKSRSSKLKKIGGVVKTRLIEFNALRRKYRYIARANAEIQTAINKTEGVNLNSNTMRLCREAARKIEELIFSVEGA